MRTHPNCVLIGSKDTIGSISEALISTGVHVTVSTDLDYSFSPLPSERFDLLMISIEFSVDDIQAILRRGSEQNPLVKIILLETPGSVMDAELARLGVDSYAVLTSDTSQIIARYWAAASYPSVW
jgi:DNA-binding response OmpR family regulator